MAYERRYRERVLSYIEAGHSYLQAQEVYGVGPTAIRRWRKLQRETGSLQDKAPVRKHRKMDPEKLSAYIQSHPDAYLQEVAETFGCSSSGVAYALKKLGITRKKRRRHTENAMKRKERITKQ